MRTLNSYLLSPLKVVSSRPTGGLFLSSSLRHYYQTLSVRPLRSDTLIQAVTRRDATPQKSRRLVFANASTNRDRTYHGGTGAKNADMIIPAAQSVFCLRRMQLLDDNES